MAQRYSDFRKFSILNSNLANSQYISYSDYLELQKLDKIINILDILVKMQLSQNISAHQYQNGRGAVPVKIVSNFENEIDNQQCIVNYQKMSSKYSEFRKFLGLQRQDSQQSNNSLTDGLNIQQINNMIDFLASPLKLSPKKAPYTGMAKKSPRMDANNSQIKLYSSRKNSQANQTSDLTTNVDSQTISHHHIEKLSPVHKNTYRRHHTERQSTQNTIELNDMIEQNESGNCFDFQKEQYLLDQIQQKEENQITPPLEQLKWKLQQKLHNIQLKLNNKKMNATQANNLLEKLNSLQILIDQI